MFFDTFKFLCDKKGVSCKRAAEEIGLSNSIATKWKKTGATPQGDTLNRIAEYFGVTTDYLLSGVDAAQEKAPALTKKDERDIARQLEALKQSLESGESLMFDGDPMTDEARESILQAMELGLRAAKLKSKEKFTPKKYRKD